MKIVVLLAFSIMIFFVGSWPAMAACAALVLLVLLTGRVPLGLVGRLLTPVYVLAGFSVLFNFMGNPGLAGLANGLFFGCRMVVLVAASYAVCLTTTSNDLLDAFRGLIGPLRALRVPADDIAFTLALSLRFIPVIQKEFVHIRRAQVARGADGAGSAGRTLQMWGSAFSALFVGLFRHADTLASAMDARCYGASAKRTRLPK